MAAVLGVAGSLAAGTRQAQGGFTVELDSVAPVGGATQYSYSATIPSMDEIVAGNFFRIYDFGGLTGTPSVPAGWSVTLDNSNPTPPPNVSISHGDDPSIVNATFTYNGSSPILGGAMISGFVLTSTTPPGSTTTKDFVGLDTRATDGSSVSSIGNIAVPSATAAVPEPPSLISGGIGMLVLGILSACLYGKRRACAA